MDDMDFDFATEDGDEDTGPITKRSEETEEDYNKRKKILNDRKLIQQMEEAELWDKAEEMELEVKSLSKPVRLRATKDKASIYQLIYDRKAQEEEKGDPQASVWHLFGVRLQSSKTIWIIDVLP